MQRKKRQAPSRCRLVQTSCLLRKSSAVFGLGPEARERGVVRALKSLIEREIDNAFWGLGDRESDTQTKGKRTQK